MSTTLVTRAESTTGLSKVPAGKLRRPLERDVASRSAIQIAESLSENSPAALILLLLLHFTTAHCTSGDAIWMAVSNTRDRCREMGIDETLVNGVLEKFTQFSADARKSKWPKGFC